MTLKLIERGNIFASLADALVIPVNCVGVAGKGLALEFKKLYPSAHRHYVSLCKEGALRPGAVAAYQPGSRPRLIYFPTKQHWRNPSKWEWVRDGLDALIAYLTKHEVKFVAIPALGCGLGGLPWSTVRDLIVYRFSGPNRLCDVDVELYAPHDVEAVAQVTPVATQHRMESGVTQFGDDWPGVFLRGDEAHGYATDLKAVLEAGAQDTIEEHSLRDLLILLQSCQTPCDQTIKLKQFGECVKFDVSGDAAPGAV